MCPFRFVLIFTLVLSVLGLTNCSCSRRSEINTVVEPVSNLGAASALVWTTPVYQLNTSVSWALATGSNIASQQIQYYSDGMCGTTSGSAVSVSNTATTANFLGIDLATYSFKVISTDNTNHSVISACSSALTIDISSCTGSRITNSPYADGTGTTLDPYLICTPAQMNTIGLTTSDWSKSFKLISDLDLSIYTGTAYNIIGSAATKFTGTFDGNNHTISNFSVASTTLSGVGLFGFVSGSGSLIQNLVITNAIVFARLNNVRVGTIAGSINGGTISNCKVLSGTLIQNLNVISQVAGGVVGELISGTMINIVSAVTVLAGHRSMYLGGVVGTSTGSTITSASYTGTFTSGNSSSISGGVVGYLDNSSVTLSYSSAVITGNASTTIGGLVGTVVGTSNITKSFSTSTVSGGVFYLGGLLGSLNSDPGYGVYNCYANGSVTAGNHVDTSGGLIGTVGSTGPVVINSYASGLVTPTGGVGGGLVGEDNSGGGVNYGVYTASYWDNQVNGAISNGIGNGSTPAGITAANTAAMKNTLTFSGAGWVNTAWNLTTTGSYIKLFWQP